MTGFENAGTPHTTLHGNTDGNVRPNTEVVDPRYQVYTGAVPTNNIGGRPTVQSGPMQFATATVNGNDADGNGGTGTGNVDDQIGNVTVCVDGSSLTVPRSQLQNYMAQGASIGPCNAGGGGGGTGPIGHPNPVGASGEPVEPFVHPAPGVEPVGGVHPVGNNGDPIDPVVHQPGGNGGGNNGNGYNNGWGNNGWNGQGSFGGPGCVTGTGNYGYGGGYYNSSYIYTGCNSCSNSWYVGSGCGHLHGGGFCGACSGQNHYYSSNYMNNCNSYYGYGNYYPASYNYGYCYTGLYTGISYTLIYPWVPTTYKLNSFVPSENRRVVILDSKNGRHHWRIVEERVWMPERVIWDNGAQRTQDGYYTWLTIEKVKYRHRKHHCRICDPNYMH